MTVEDENITPAAIAADRPTSDEENPSSTTTTTPPSSQRLRRRCFICCGSCTAVVVVIAVALLIIALTVYKVKDPVITMNSVSIGDLKIDLGSSLSVNLTLVVDISVKNPNRVSFRFEESTTNLYYRGREIGVAHGPPGTAAARETFKLNVTVDVMADRILAVPNLSRDILRGKINFTTSTKLGGIPKIFLIFKPHVDVAVNCSLTLAVSNKLILTKHCHQSARL